MLVGKSQPNKYVLKKRNISALRIENSTSLKTACLYASFACKMIVIAGTVAENAYANQACKDERICM